MSSITIKPAIQCVQSTIGITANSIMTAGSMLASASKSLSTEAMKIYQTLQESIINTTITLQPAFAVNQQAIIIQQQALNLGQEKGLSTQETMQIAALATADLFVADRPQAIQQAMQMLSINPTQAALKNFTQELMIEHQPLVAQSLRLACQQASLEVGFTDIQTNIAADGTLRVIASDNHGRSLVTEIGTAIDRDTTIATEIIGMSDSSCSQILDEFDIALEAAGVRSGRPERKSTGGVCELEAAKEFIRRQPVRSKAAATSSKVSTQNRQMPKRQQNQQF